MLAPGQSAPRDLSRRSDAREWLDGDDLDPAELEAVLRDLARFNGAMLGHWPVLAWLKKAVKAAPKDRPLTLLDVGCGYGDLLRAIRAWARKREVPIKLIGLDLSEKTVAIARAATDPRDDIDYLVGDAFEFLSPAPIDFIVSSLLTHHLSDALIVRFIRWMETTAVRGWLIYDLQRHWVPYRVIGLMGRLMHLHPMVVHDGQISVERSLSGAEWYKCLRQADVRRKGVRPHWFLFRWVIGRRR